MTLSRDELVERLKKLAESEPPKNLSRGAMCYDPGFSKREEKTCPACSRMMGVGELVEIIQSYRIPLKRIQDQGVDAVLIIPKHCTVCGYDLREENFHLKIQYPDQPDPVQIELTCGAYDLEIMALFLLGMDRYTASNDGETALKDKIDRLRELFGVAEQK
jgi:predicted Zn-ribbon and HTH transcriptional regulator